MLYLFCASWLKSSCLQRNVRYFKTLRYHRDEIRSGCGKKVDICTKCLWFSPPRGSEQAEWHPCLQPCRYFVIKRNHKSAGASDAHGSKLY